MLASRSDYFKALLDHAAIEAADRDDSQSAAEAQACEEAAEVRALLDEMQLKHSIVVIEMCVPARCVQADTTRVKTALVGNDHPE